ncbi:hypothetical protein RFI_32578 [Reticulomyxa filosa]|uniref:Uncharacterized protein n=1 Tax=Reticulomyxa filosa TaxID=46433 RepID=X6LT49_RETFI|nr:hypothetical protein RFI_32578 [Reticulomyxa filosa]|eukprot:ETO04819.1 hypothetical protein RFI_32578 [Reticulomyxa filosa]
MQHCEDQGKYPTELIRLCGNVMEEELKRQLEENNEKTLLDITTVALALLFKQSNKAKFYNMELALEISSTNTLLCKVQQLPKKKENNQCVLKTTPFEKKMLPSRPKQIRLPIVVSPYIGSIQVDVVHLSSHDLLHCKQKYLDKGEITYTIIYQKHFFFSLIKKTQLKKRNLQPWKEVNLMNVDKSLQLFSMSRFSKAELMKKGTIEKKNMTPQLQPVVETLQRRLSVRQDRSVLQKRGILKLTKEPMAMITDSENFAQLGEQNEDNIAAKRHYEHIFSNEFVNKTALDQIIPTHNRQLADDTLVDNNDVNELSMI